MSERVALVNMRFKAHPWSHQVKGQGSWRLFSGALIICLLQVHLACQDPVEKEANLDLRALLAPQVGWDFQAEKACRDQLDPPVKSTVFLISHYNLYV